LDTSKAKGIEFAVSRAAAKYNTLFARAGELLIMLPVTGTTNQFTYQV